MSLIKSLKGIARDLLQPTGEGGLIEAVKHRSSELVILAKVGLSSARWPQRPDSINFEITSICDAKCIHCPRQGMDRTMKPMDFTLFKKMVDQAAEMGVPELYPNGYGELLTMRNLDDYLEYISDREHRFRVCINTNGFRMTEEKIELFIKHKVHLLNICMDGATAETAEAIRVQLKLDEIEKNIHRLMAIRKERGLDYPKVRAGIIVIPQNRHEVTQFCAKWKGVVDYVGIAGASSRLGSLSTEMTEFGPKETASACVLPFRDLTLLSDGKAVLCCQDWNEEHVVGDLNTQSLREIWHGPELIRVRELHLKARGGDVAICAKCNYWAPPMPGTRLWS
jgi:MoaA/NifB/PqqE/SkfB family radical SAM enzyme